MENIKVENKADETPVADLLLSYNDVFSKSDHDLGLCTLTEHTIETGDAKPIKQPPRCVPLAFANEDRKALDELT